MVRRSAGSDVASTRGSRLPARRRRSPQVELASGLAPAPDGHPAASAANTGPVDPRTTGLATLAELLEDSLTGLGSVAALRRDLESLIEMFQPFGSRPALFLVDIDGFAEHNAGLGRERADRVLVAVGERLATTLPPGSAAYRSGGDEFAGLVPAISTVEAVEAAGRLREALSRPLPAGDREVAVTVSVAVVMLGQRRRADALFRDADVTMFRAKAEGGDRVDVYNWEVDSWSTTRKRDLARLEREVEELRQQNRVLAEALTLDLSTGLPNAIAFEADHEQVDSWRRRSGEPYSILRVRVDGLGSDPAFMGPDGVGALEQVALAVRDTVRRSDRAYLLGPGDLVVLLRSSATKEAVSAAERVRRGVAQRAVGYPGAPGKVLTVTVAAIEAGFRHSHTGDVLAEVERLLGDAVQAGGDRIVWPH